MNSTTRLGFPSLRDRHVRLSNCIAFRYGIFKYSLAASDLQITVHLFALKRILILLSVSADKECLNGHLSCFPTYKYIHQAHITSFPSPTRHSAREESRFKSRRTRLSFMASPPFSPLILISVSASEPPAPLPTPDLSCLVLVEPFITLAIMVCPEAEDIELMSKSILPSWASDRLRLISR